MRRPPRAVSADGNKGHKRRRKNPSQDSDQPLYLEQSSVMDASSNVEQPAMQNQHSIGASVKFSTQQQQLEYSGRFTNSAWPERFQEWQIPLPMAAAVQGYFMDPQTTSTAAGPSSTAMANSATPMSWEQNEESNIYDFGDGNVLDMSLVLFGGNGDSGEKSGERERLFFPASTPAVPIIPSNSVPLGIPASGNAETSASISDSDISIFGFGCETNSGLYESARNLSSGPDRERRESYMQRLSSLSLNLSTRLGAIDGGSQDVNAKTLTNAPEGKLAPAEKY